MEGVHGVIRRALFAAALLLGGCEGVVAKGADISQDGVRSKQAYNDAKALVLVQAPCDISLGAAQRVLTADQRAAVIGLCWPDRATVVRLDLEPLPSE